MSEICRYHKIGYCKYKEHCRYMHVSEICEDQTCEINSCRKRHPKTCYYYKKYGRCKFGAFCKFLHKEPHVVENCENEKLTSKMNQLENQINICNSKLGALMQ